MATLTKPKTEEFFQTEIDALLAQAGQGASLFLTNNADGTHTLEADAAPVAAPAAPAEPAPAAEAAPTPQPSA